VAPKFDSYTMLQLTDLHISRLFPALCARAVVERANGLGASLIVMTGDLIDAALAALGRGAAARAPDGV
jgi:predicted MPP superfamily phosphohydrolase